MILREDSPRRRVHLVNLQVMSFCRVGGGAGLAGPASGLLLLLAVIFLTGRSLTSPASLLRFLLFSFPGSLLVDEALGTDRLSRAEVGRGCLGVPAVGRGCLAAGVGGGGEAAESLGVCAAGRGAETEFPKDEDDGSFGEGFGEDMGDGFGEGRGDGAGECLGDEIWPGLAMLIAGFRIAGLGA